MERRRHGKNVAYPHLKYEECQNHIPFSMVGRTSTLKNTYALAFILETPGLSTIIKQMNASTLVNFRIILLLVSTKSILFISFAFNVPLERHNCHPTSFDQLLLRMIQIMNVNNFFSLVRWQ